MFSAISTTFPRSFRTKYAFPPRINSAICALKRFLPTRPYSGISSRPAITPPRSWMADHGTREPT